MKRILFALVTLILIAGCNGSQSPVEPRPDCQIDRTAEFWGQTMPPDWKANGTLMSYADLAYYFGAHMAEAYLPGGMSNPQYCPLFKALELFITNHYPLGYKLVRFYERNYCDIPNEIDITAPCE